MSEPLSTALVIIGLVLAVTGVAGSILPVLPGPILSLLSLFLLSLAKHWQPFSPAFLIVMTVLMAVVWAMDFFVPLITAKKMGASKYGIWGSVAGMLLGMFFFPPWSIILGALAGAIAGEYIVMRDIGPALRAGWGIFWGNMATLVLKLAYTGTVLFFYVFKMF